MVWVFVEKLVVSGVELLDNSRVANQHVDLMPSKNTHVHNFPVAQKISGRSEGWVVVITSVLRYLSVLFKNEQVAYNRHGAGHTDDLVRLALVVPFDLVKLDYPSVEVVRQAHPEQGSLY